MLNVPVVFVTFGVVMADALRWSYVAAQDNPTDNAVPAWWSDFYFNNAVDGSLDSDGDGFSNHREYILGTDPTDASSTFTTSHTLTTSNIQLSFNPILGGRVYKLATTTNLANTAWTLLNTTERKRLGVNERRGCFHLNFSV